ncbi:ABC transporter permease [Corallococcus soli]|nr:FtsX-like permease family protein [Corallococcus soli]
MQLRLAARNTLRSRTRTLLTLGMVALSVALLLVALTWIRGAFGSMLLAASALGGHVRVVDPDFEEREELMPLHEHLTDTGALTRLLRRQPGVRAVEPRITAGVTLSAGEEIGDVFARVMGAHERYFRERLGADQKLVAGTWFTGAPDELVVGARVVERLGAKVGDALVLLGTTQDGSLSSLQGRLVGVVHGGGLEQQVLAPLERVQWLVDMPDEAVELLVFTDDLHGAPDVAARLRRVPQLQGLAVRAWSEREPLKSTLASVKGVEGVVVFLFVFLTALGIWNTLMMSVLERMHEIGVLRALGLSRLGAVGLFVGEALMVSGAGGLLGIALGLGPAWMLERYGIRIGAQAVDNLALPLSETLHGELTLETVGMAFGLGWVMAVLGSILPALRAASIPPVAAMRSGR